MKGDDLSTNGAFADRIADAVNDKFMELCANQENDDFHKMKVLAGICMTRYPCSDESTEVPEVISIGTGTKTIRLALIIFTVLFNRQNFKLRVFFIFFMFLKSAQATYSNAE